MTLDEMVAERLRRGVSAEGFGTKEHLHDALRLLAKWRSELIGITIASRQGNLIRQGPFAGMRFVTESTEGGRAPRLLGCYEAELHASVERIVAQPFDAILDIGCAEGYYAVGLARRMPGAIVHAFDIDAAARARCAELATLNDVAERVVVGGAFLGANFADFAQRRTLVFMDAEGAEDGLLRPDLYPALRGMTVLVECHDALKPGLCTRIEDRFKASHAIERIESQLSRPPLPDWLNQLGHLDQLLAVWEWRSGPTPWLYMEPRASKAVDGSAPSGAL